jgi:NAD(P)-dependent dehydrogenase (short-subunit alcohol dehydrogenase family)
MDERPIGIMQGRLSPHYKGKYQAFPNDLIGPCIFLASDSSEYISGQDIYVDGGWMAKGL